MHPLSPPVEMRIGPSGWSYEVEVFQCGADSPTCQAPPPLEIYWINSIGPDGQSGSGFAVGPVSGSALLIAS